MLKVLSSSRRFRCNLSISSALILALARPMSTWDPWIKSWLNTKSMRKLIPLIFDDFFGSIHRDLLVTEIHFLFLSSRPFHWPRKLAYFWGGQSLLTGLKGFIHLSFFGWNSSFSMECFYKNAKSPDFYEEKKPKITNVCCEKQERTWQVVHRN